MKQYVLLFFMTVLSIIAAPVDEIDVLYQQGSYQEILDTYASDNDNNAATWCIVGNAACCLQKYNEAYLYWLRAQRYGNEHIYSITSKNMQLLDMQGFVPPKHNVYTWLIWLSKYIGIYILQILFIFVWYVLCMMIYKKNRLLLLTSTLFLACCLLAPIIATYHFHQQKGLIMEDATIYNGPNSAYYALGSAPKGTLIKVKNVDGDWIKIIYNDTIGWIGRTYVGLLGIREFETKKSSASALR